MGWNLFRTREGVPRGAVLGHAELIRYADPEKPEANWVQIDRRWWTNHVHICCEGQMVDRFGNRGPDLKITDDLAEILQSEWRGWKSWHHPRHADE